MFFFAPVDNGMPPRLPMSRPAIVEFTICFSFLWPFFVSIQNYSQSFEHVPIHNLHKFFSGMAGNSRKWYKFNLDTIKQP